MGRAWATGESETIMKLIKKNKKLFIVIYLFFCVSILICITNSFAIQKPSFLTGAGDVEVKVRNGVSSLINWFAVIFFLGGTFIIILGYIMLVVPVLGQQGKAKSFLLGGAGALVVGVAILLLAGYAARSLYCLRCR